MNKYGKLINNSLIFALGSLGSKIILIILVPLYTFSLSSSDYGKVDLVTSVQALLLPFITLTTEQAILRYIIGGNNEDDRRVVFSSALLVTFVSLLVLLSIFFLVYIFGNFDIKNLIYFYIIIFFSALHILFSTRLRAVGKNRQFAISGVLQVFSILILNLILMFYYKLGIDGYFVSLILSYIISLTYCVISDKSNIITLTFKDVNYKSIYTILAFSLPLIPNYSMWWFVNNSTRYFILSYVGLYANGLFAVASKLPSFISLFIGVFQQAWQISAFEEHNSEERDKYYTEVFKAYYQFLFLIASILLFFDKIIFASFVSSTYSTAWKIVPLLILGLLYQTFSSFLGTIYTSSYKTKSVLYTSFVGAAISISANYIIIPWGGITYAGLGATLGFLVMWFLRLIGTSKIIAIKINHIEFITFNFVFLFQSFALFYFDDRSFIFQGAVQFIAIFVNIILARSIVRSLFQFVIKAFNKYFRLI
ncbi:oligosaccharide flippase family protein [Pluralibacter gergoviae]|nr:oligosaccharide flippase family protein [Pluralibacter gergoviae]ELC3016774.1 oligosaccharide flippase family protein [Pluralibacter gergoviae]ELC3022293.1 oligosaccharide flippase family protein [Pluralibacter gergoviae]